MHTKFRAYTLSLSFATLIGCATGPAGVKSEAELTVAPTVATPTFAAGRIAAGATRDLTFASVRSRGNWVTSRSIALQFTVEQGDTALLTSHGVQANGAAAVADTELFVFRANRGGNATGRALAYNDDFDGEVSSYIEFVAPESGTYVVITQRYDRRARGRIRVALDVQPARRACGSRGLAQCRENEFCAWEAGANCGRADAPGHCERRPEACITLYRPVCGCDRQTYSNACSAASAGVSVETDGECPNPCRAFDAHGQGQCRRLPFGYAWDGERCSVVQGCECIGEDCARLYPNEEECRTSNTSCFSSCLATAAWGQGACDRVLGYKWDGNACVAVSGCECNGRACAALVSEADCLTQYAYCAPDCRTTGCNAGSNCQVCWAGYACLPEGAVC